MLLLKYFKKFENKKPNKKNFEMISETAQQTKIEMQNEEPTTEIPQRRFKGKYRIKTNIHNLY
jgi:hypothetical protein